MLLSLCLLLSVLRPSRQEICSAPGVLPAPTLHLSQTSAQPGDSVQLQCSVLSQTPFTRVVFCQDGMEVTSQKGSLWKFIYSSDYVVSSSGSYSCGYEIKDSNSRVNRSQLSPARHLSVITKGDEWRQLPASSPVLWATGCALVLLILVSVPVVYFVLKKRGETGPAPACEAGGEFSGKQQQRNQSPGSVRIPLKSSEQDLGSKLGCEETPVSSSKQDPGGKLGPEETPVSSSKQDPGGKLGPEETPVSSSKQDPGGKLGPEETPVSSSEQDAGETPLVSATE